MFFSSSSNYFPRVKVARRPWWTLSCNWERFATTPTCSSTLRYQTEDPPSSKVVIRVDTVSDRIHGNIHVCFVFQESFSEHLGYSGGIVSGYVKLELCVFILHLCVLFRGLVHMEDLQGHGDWNRACIYLFNI